MRKQREARSFFNFGFTTILLSFVMICVVIFSALSLITANADYTLSKKVAEKTQKYYEAEKLAYEKLVSIDQLLLNTYQNSNNEYEYYSKLEKTMLNYGTITINDGQYYLSFTETISDQQHLSIVLSLPYPTEDTDTFYQIINWKSVYTTGIPEDENLNLFQ